MSGERATSPLVGHSSDRRSPSAWAVLVGATALVGLLLVSGAAGHLGSSKGVSPINRLGAERFFPPAPPPLVLNGPTPNATVVDVSQIFNITVNVTGGSGNGSHYNYTWLGLPTGCANNWSWSENCTPTAIGVFNVKVHVNDTLVNVNATSSAVTITVNALPTLTGFTVTKANLTVNSSITFTATTSGGTAPFTFKYSGLPLGCSSNASSFQCTPNRPGLYNVTVTAVDANGYSTSTKNIPVRVNATAVTVASTGIGTTGWAVVIGILVIGSIATVALLLQARREEHAGRMGMDESKGPPSGGSGGTPPTGGAMPPMPPGPQS